MSRVPRRFLELAPAPIVRLDLPRQSRHEGRRTHVSDELLDAPDADEVNHDALPRKGGTPWMRRHGRHDPRRPGQKTAGNLIKRHIRSIKSPTPLSDLLECCAGPAKQAMPPMDDLDHRLLALLRGDARAAVASLAKKLGVARGTVQNRMARLEADGTIAGYTVRLKPDIQQQQIRALMTIAVEGNQVDAVVKALRGEP